MLDILSNLWYVVVTKIKEKEKNAMPSKRRPQGDGTIRKRADGRGKDELSSGIRKMVHRYSNRCSAGHKNPH